jgi:hypothetical protein
VDHRDRDPLNNRRINLRAVTHAGNSQNREAAGYYKSGDKFIAQIKANGKNYNLGSWDTPELAQQAYQVAKTILHRIDERA